MPDKVITVILQPQLQFWVNKHYNCMGFGGLKMSTNNVTYLRVHFKMSICGVDVNFL